ncbi:MAG: CTD kinase subunit gamma CTK3-domain-containing protein [Linnemannia gamsii]|nr:MAG: CTD kinase subunit gamma CTK3-domain-containing protein [Linnemannia gamsii]
MEVDPFEARLEFLSLLGKLNASQHSIQKVGNFAMKNRKLHEDLYNCIIEELEQTKSLNTRMNIFYVLDSICHQSHKAGFSGYIDLIQKNLSKIIECVTPSGPKGNVNVAGTKKILELWRVRKLFSDSALDKVEKPLLSRELGANAPTSFDTGFTKDDILKRMDEDRERHKRIREEIWIRPSEEDPGAEFLQNWDEVSDIDEVDYEDMEGENEKYLPGYPWDLEFDRFLPSPAIFKLKPSLSAKLMESVFSDTSSSNSNSENNSNSMSAVKRLTSPEGTVSIAGSTATSRHSSASSTVPFAKVPGSATAAQLGPAPALPVAPPLPPPPPPLPPSLPGSSSGPETATGPSTKSNYYSQEYRDHHSHSHSHNQHQHHSHNYSSNSNNNNSSTNSSSHHSHHPHHQQPHHHSHHQQPHYHSSSNSSSLHTGGNNNNNVNTSSSNNNSGTNHSRSHSSHSSSYYDHAIPTGPAADTAPAAAMSTSSNTSSRRASPSTSSSSYHPYSRSHYHERSSSNNSTHSGYANGRGDHA